ncbi:MAG: phosphatidate cytidylyltransferase [Propionibacteriaceae bacterium]
MAAEPTAGVPTPASDHGRAGRNLPAAIGVGVGLGAALVLSLLFFHWGFVLIVALALSLGAVELYQAMLKLGMRAAIVPIVAGTVLIVVGSYLAGIQNPVIVPSNTILLAALGLTVLASLIWRMPQGQDGFVKDTAASLMIIAYLPLMGAFVALMLAGSQGSARIVTFLLVVTMSDLGGYVFGALLGRHPMAPRISPKKSWEGFGGSVVFGVASGVLMCIFVLDVPFWVGIILGVCLVGAGTCGDLVESLIKRDVGIKDMSSFLPGHGGVMDRLDSLLLAAPVAWLIMFLLVPGG